MTKARSNATANAAKGDLTVGNGTNLSGVLAVGSNGDTIVADSSTATGLRYQGLQAAGKNAVIGGSFDIWQRGTAATTSSAAYTGADRWFSFTMTNANSSQVTLAAGSPCTYGVKFTSTSGTNSVLYGTALESQTLDPLRGQTVTLSFYAYCSTGTVSLISYAQKNATPNTLQAGSWTTLASPTNTVTTTPTRFSATFALAGDSTTAGLRILFGADNFTNGANFVIYGVQLEVGSVATAFTRAGGTIQGELAACQRYYQVIGGTTNSFPLIGGYITNGETLRVPMVFPVQMRVAPTITKNGTWEAVGIGQPSAVYNNTQGFSIQAVGTANGYYLHPNSTDDSFTMSAEL